MFSNPSLPPAQQPPQMALAPVDATVYDSAARLSMVDTGKMAFTGMSPSSHMVLIDTSKDVGGENAGPEPLELLLLALGSCTGMDVISILRKKRQKVTHYSVNVYANLAKDYPKTYTKILVEHVVGGENLDPAAVSRSLELSITKYCPVHALLARATQVEHVYRLLGTIDKPPNQKTLA
jgi:putative redox protein